MIRKKLIVLAVASTCASPMFAAAAGASQAYEVGHWEVVTPSSVDESAPYRTGMRSHRGSGYAGAGMQAYSLSAHAEVITPHSVDESAPWLTSAEKQQRNVGVRTDVASLPNVQTPWSPNESGAVSYADDMRARARHVASVEQARLAVASHNEQLARMQAAAVQASTERPTALDAEIDRLLLGSPARPAERDPEAVASTNAALLDTRRSAVTEVRTDNAASDLQGFGSTPAPILPEVDRTPEIGPGTARSRTETVADASAPLQGGGSDSTSAAGSAAESPLATGATAGEAAPSAETRVSVEGTPPAH